MLRPSRSYGIIATLYHNTACNTIHLVTIMDARLLRNTGRRIHASSMSAPSTSLQSAALDQDTQPNSKNPCKRRASRSQKGDAGKAPKATYWQQVKVYPFHKTHDHSSPAASSHCYCPTATPLPDGNTTDPRAHSTQKPQQPHTDRHPPLTQHSEPPFHSVQTRR